MLKRQARHMNRITANLNTLYDRLPSESEMLRIVQDQIEDLNENDEDDDESEEDEQ